MGALTGAASSSQHDVGQAVGVPCSTFVDRLPGCFGINHKLAQLSISAMADPILAEIAQGRLELMALIYASQSDETPVTLTYEQLGAVFDDEDLSQRITVSDFVSLSAASRRHLNFCMLRPSKVSSLY